MNFSRLDEEKIIEGLVAERPSIEKVCVDIGAKNSMDNSNVANLIVNHGWRGVLLERGIKCFHGLIQAWSGWPVCISHIKVTPDNVHYLLPSSFGVLSIDIDGQDYYIWEAINVRPEIVIIEYNSKKSGHDVMPRDDRYVWKKNKDYKRFGASQNALVALGKKKGYRLVCSNRDNLFFAYD